MLRLAALVTSTISSIPALTASSTISWITGTSTIGSISLGMALVAGKKRVPSPAAGMTALRILKCWLIPFFGRRFPALVDRGRRGFAAALVGRAERLGGLAGHCEDLLGVRPRFGR